jgi:hypothetical protein
MYHFLSPEGLYHQSSRNAEYADLCDWVSTRQYKLCIVHDYFKHYYLKS